MNLVRNRKLDLLITTEVAEVQRQNRCHEANQDTRIDKIIHGLVVERVRRGRLGRQLRQFAAKRLDDRHRPIPVLGFRSEGVGYFNEPKPRRGVRLRVASYFLTISLEGGLSHAAHQPYCIRDFLRCLQTGTR
jgi:hypothetical protein